MDAFPGIPDVQAYAGLNFGQSAHITASDLSWSARLEIIPAPEGYRAALLWYLVVIDEPLEAVMRS